MDDFRRIFPKIEPLFFLVVFGSVFPILGFLVGWWGSIPLLAEEHIKYGALGGLLVGILIDILFLKRWIIRAYQMNLAWLILIYLFYSVGLFGFFMGVPVFNALLGLFAGFYMGLRMAEEKKSKAKAEGIFRKTGYFTALVLAIVCVAALWIASMDGSLAANINGMFALKNPLSNSTILLLSGIGGMGLAVLEFYITRGMARRAYR